MSSPYFYPTYNLNRKCLHCGTAIADQAHGSQKFCARLDLNDGSIKNCKDDFHSARRKQRNMPFLKVALFHKQMHQQILALLEAYGETVSLEQINNYGIMLNRPVEFSNENQRTIFLFIEYGFKEYKGNTFRIYKHGKVF